MDINNENNNNDSLYELNRLKEKKELLDLQFNKNKDEKIKNFHIRNLKVFKHTCNMLLPVVISTGITVGCVFLLDDCLPFHLDKIEKSKVYSLDYESDHYTNFEEEYLKKGSLPTNELMISTPWMEENNQYSKTKREYSIGELDSLDLFDAVLESDYDYIEENFKKYMEEIQTSNYINDDYLNDYVVKAKLYMRDREDVLILDESKLKNTLVTIFELFVGVGIGSVINYLRYFNYLERIRKSNKDYKNIVNRGNLLKKELEETNQKILTLKKHEGVK